MADPVHGGNGHGTNGHSNGHADNGHGGVQFEKTDVQTGGLYVFLLITAAIVIGAVGGMLLLFDYLAKEADRQNYRIATLVREAAREPGEVLPFGGSYDKPLLEGIRGTDPDAPRSGIKGYTSLAIEAKKSAGERLATYGYLDKDHKHAHVPVEVAMELLLESGALKARTKGPAGVEFGTVVNPYSFWKSDSSSGRKPLGETRSLPEEKK